MNWMLLLFTSRYSSLSKSPELDFIIDSKRGNYFVGRTEFDSPDVDNEVLIDARKTYLKVGEFVKAKIVDASDFDLYASVIKQGIINPQKILN